MEFQITGVGGYSLNDVYDLLLDGHFGVKFDEGEVIASSSGAGAFSAGSGPLPDIIVRPKQHISNEQFEKLLEKIRDVIGPNGHVHVLDRK